MLLHEEKASCASHLPQAPTPNHSPISRPRAETSPATDEPSPTIPHRVPLIWARGGLTSTWIRELVSSDALFVKGERERYDLARTVVELRRRQGIDEEEERDWDIMFRDGIYYTNMVPWSPACPARLANVSWQLVDDIIAISQDISPTTGRPFVPISVLQDAHWTQSLLRCNITAGPRRNSSPTSSPSPRDKELGICVSTAEILSRLSDSPEQHTTINEKYKVYYPVAQDSSLRIGDSNGIEGASMDQLFDLPAPTDRKSLSRAATSETNFFGLKAERKTAVDCVASDATGKARWSPYPPCRFAVEFWDIDSLKEKSRLHSHTIWYAGNLFNVYVQVVRKKGIQLGMYLHRQSSVDPVPAPSAPVQTGIRGEHNHNRVPSPPQQIHSSVSSSTLRHSPSMQPVRSGTPSSPPSTSSGHTTYQSTGNAIPATAPPVSPLQPYRDPRSSVSAYFSISCTSTTGSSITRFTSVPDVFSVSQSWGWKSSSLRSEEMGEVRGADGQPIKSPVPAPKELSLRATVVLGVV